MWFKNIHIFRFLKPFTLSAEELEEKLTEAAFHPAGSMEMESIGWVPPLGNDSESLVHIANNCIMLTARKEEKILPASVIRDFVNDKVEEIENQQMRKVRKAEKADIREQVLLDLIPRAFSRSNYQFAYIDIDNAWLIIDTSSRKRAEEFTSFLRQTLGSLPVVSPKMKNNPAQTMTQWLIKENQCPAIFELADACVLTDISEEGAVVNCKRQDLFAEEMQGHLAAGKLVTRLALEWNQRFNLILDDELVIRRLQFSDLIQTQLDDNNAETKAQQFDADFIIMNSELVPFIKSLFEVFGGEDEETYEKML